MAQEQVSLKILQERKALADAEKATIEAEAARDDARKKRAAPPTPVDTDPDTKAKNKTVATAMAAKEIADAKKLQAEAENAVRKARIGDIPASGISGSTKLSDKAGAFETALLAAHATVAASVKLVERLSLSTLVPRPANLFVFPASALPGFQAASAFVAQRAAILAAFRDALDSAVQAAKPDGKVIRPESLVAAGAAMEAVSRILGYFRSDFEIGGMELTADDALLAEAVVGEIKARHTNEIEIFNRSLFCPSTVGAAAQGMTAHLQHLSAQRERASVALRDAEQRILELEKRLGAPVADPPENEAAEKRVTAQHSVTRGVMEKLKAAMQAHDLFVGKLASPDEKTFSMLKELEIWQALQEPSSYMLAVKMHKAGGSFHVEKNLWTVFGRMPFKVMGGVIVSYSLFEGGAGSVIASGVIPVHGGFVTADNVAGLFESAAGPRRVADEGGAS